MQMFARLVGQSFGTWAVDDKDKKVGTRSLFSQTRSNSSIGILLKLRDTYLRSSNNK